MADEILGNLHFQLTLDGHEGTWLFTAAIGGGSENAVIEVRISQPNGSIGIQKVPGNLKFNDITLKRGVDPDRRLWDWRQQVVDGHIAAARRNGTIQILDSTFAPVATYAFERGWVSRYTLVSMSGGQNEAAVEEITIAFEDFKRE